MQLWINLHNFAPAALISSSDNTNTGSTVHTNAHYDANPPSNVSGAIYVRWGHHECPPSSKLIYSGKYYTHFSCDFRLSAYRVFLKTQSCMPDHVYTNMPNSFIYGKTTQTQYQ